MAEVKQINVEEAYQIYQQKDANTVFVDVREPEEWEEGVIPGVVKISLGDIEDNLEKLDKSKKHVMFCKVGGRSNRASSILAENNFTEVYNVQGGMMDWYDNDYPTEEYTHNV